MNYDDYYTKGYVVLENVFSSFEIESFKNEILNYTKIKGLKSHSITDFVNLDPELKTVINIKNNDKIHNALKMIFKSDDYRFCQHSDISINNTNSWHKDRLNGIYRQYEKYDIWNSSLEDKHEIVKVLLYLEDHTHDDEGLKIIDGSHLDREIHVSTYTQLKPKIGDVIIFDQRVTHRGTSCVTKERILVTFGFGKNNKFTDQFEKGTVSRQNDQNRHKRRINQ